MSSSATMNYLVLLDAGPLGMITNPRESEKTRACKNWIEGILAAGVNIMIPEGADYEVRRELIRAGPEEGIARLDQFGIQLEYLPITNAVLRRAAEIWAQMRNNGTPTADAKALDFDVVLRAQAQLLQRDDLAVVVATKNTSHSERFCDAREWDRIGPTF